MKIPFLGAKDSKSPKPKLLENPYGISTVYTPDGPHKIDIIFIHGLGGGSRKTWAHDPCDYSTFWPGEWLPHEEGFKDARIHTFGYNANFHGEPTQYAILDFARELMQELWVSRSDFGKMPIIFAGHSMGGLVSKKAYIVGKNNPQNFARITPAIKAMMFLATPHMGSSHSKLLNNILSVVPTKGRQQYVNDLNISSITIRTISELFKGVMGDLLLASLYEVFPLKILPGYNKMIVQKHHAVLGAPGELVRPMDANHRTICKFSSKQDPNYIAVVNVLRMLVLQVLADEQRKKHVDPFAIPPFKGNKTSSDGSKGKGKEAANKRHWVQKPNYASSSSSTYSIDGSSLSTGHTTMQDVPLGALGPSGNQILAEGLKHKPKCPSEVGMSGAHNTTVTKVGSCSNCEHCKEAALEKIVLTAQADLEKFRSHMAKESLRTKSF